MDDEADVSGAERAFAALRAEVAALRRAVEGQVAPDYALTLGAIVKELQAVGARLDAINEHPALTLMPERYRQGIAQAGSGLMREAVQKFDQATRDAERERQQLAGLISAARRQDEQRNWLIYTGLAAFVAALLLSPFLYAALPFGLNGRVAALVMNTDRWNAAVGAWNLVRANQKEIAACSEAAAKAKKDQRCRITVPAVVQGN